MVESTIMLHDRWLSLNEEIIACRKCVRLVEYRQEIARHPRPAFRGQNYWAKPVIGFGDPQAKVMVVGLAPGAHGSNRTGRMFTGDSSGDFLFRALYQTGFANQPVSIDSKDGLELHEVFISATCRCVPPGNKPAQDEIINCQPFIEAEVDMLPLLQGFVALGRIGFETILRIQRKNGGKLPSVQFTHGGEYVPEDGRPWIISSYHPSRQNTQTGRLTMEMFLQVWQKVRDKLISNAS